MNELTTHTQEEVPWCMLFAANIVLMDEQRDGANVELERWQEALESKDFKISRTKTKYIECNLNGDVQRAETPLIIEAREIQKEIISNTLDR